MVIEIYDDIIRISHGFEGCQRLGYIADTCNSAPETGIDDITGFFLSPHICRLVGEYQVLELHTNL